MCEGEHRCTNDRRAPGGRGGEVGARWGRGGRGGVQRTEERARNAKAGDPAGSQGTKERGFGDRNVRREERREAAIGFCKSVSERDGCIEVNSE